MHKIGKLLLITLTFSISCNSKVEDVKPHESEKFFIEFTVNGKEKIVLSQKLDSTVIVRPSSTTGSNVNSNFYTLIYRSEIQKYTQAGSPYTVRISIYHTSDEPVWENGSKTGFYKYIRQNVLPGNHNFYPSSNKMGIAIEYFNPITKKWYQTYGYKDQNGTIVAANAEQNNSNVEINRNQKYISPDSTYIYSELEIIEGRFNCKLYSDKDTLQITDGNFKTFLSL